MAWDNEDWKAAYRRYYEKHREEILQRHKVTNAQLTEEQRARRRANARAYYAKNKAKIEPRQRMSHAEYYQKHKEQLKAKARADHEENREEKCRQMRIRRTGIDPVRLRYLEHAQQGRCAICGQPETLRTKHGEVKALAIDHSHTTGECRGLLCSRCNRMIGYAQDKVAILQAAIDYLERNS